MTKPKTFPKGNAKLNEESIKVIRRGLAQGIPASYFARAYMMSGEQVRRIGRREAWAWVEEESGPPSTQTETSTAAPEPSAADVAASLARLNKLLGKE